MHIYFIPYTEKLAVGSSSTMISFIAALISGAASSEWPIPLRHGQNVSFPYWLRGLNASAVPLKTQPSPNWLFGEARHFTEICFWAYRLTGNLTALDHLIEFSERAVAQFCPNCAAPHSSLVSACDCTPTSDLQFYNLSQAVAWASTAQVAFNERTLRMAAD